MVFNVSSDFTGGFVSRAVADLSTFPTAEDIFRVDSLHVEVELQVPTLPAAVRMRLRAEQ